MRNKKGSITLETGIVFSVFLLLIVTVISVLCFYRTDALMQRAVEQSAEEFSLYPPLSVTGGDITSTVINMIPDEKADSKAFKKAVNVLSEISPDSRKNLKDILEEAVFAPVFAGNVRKNYRLRAGNVKALEPSYIDVDFVIEKDSSCIEVMVTYRTDTLAGELERKIYTAIPVYGDIELFLNGRTDGPEAADRIWEEGNFKRGDYFREYKGVNLPKLFPVIDGYNEKTGEVVAVRSIDLTAPDYTKRKRTEKILKDEIKELGKFKGASSVISGVTYEVKEEDIRSRTLKIIVPGNTGQAELEAAEGLKDYARRKGVLLEIEKYGKSYKYA